MLALALTLALGAEAVPDEGLVDDTAVKNRLFTVERRWEVGLSAGLPVNARLTEHYVFDAHVAFNVFETLAVEAMGGWAYSQWSSLTRNVTTQPGTSTRPRDELSELWEMTGHGLVGAR